MDVREQLRRYLEQRRELGEQDLVLDQMDVAEVLRLMGAAGQGSGPAAPPLAPTRNTARPPETDAGEDAAGAANASTAAPGSDRPGATGSDQGDWRSILRAAAPTPATATGDGAPSKARAGAPGGSSGAAAGSLAGEGVPAELATREADMARARKGAEPAEAGGSGQVAATPAASHESAQDRGALGSTADADAPAWLTNLGVAIGNVVTAPGRSDPFFAALDSLGAIARATEKCTRCQLHRTATHAVPGEGSPNAELVCVGEAPGANEDASGRPFVGAAGQLLTKILAAINLSREEVFICNVLKHRPPGNRNPQPGEVEACSPYLLRQLELIRPKVILTVGTFAAQTLLATKTPIGKLRGRVHLYHGIPLVVTYHPAALLRNPAWKRPTWEDVQLARRILDSAPRA